METLFTTAFDDAFREIKHYKQYPEMTPFIGIHWNTITDKVLLLGESHYIPGEDLSCMRPDETHVTDWYNNSSRNFNAYLSGYINTRNVINIAEKVKEHGHKKPLTIYYNLKAAIKEQAATLSKETYVFPYFSVCNYFQRPAFIETDSIINSPIDDDMAYLNLKNIVKIISPDKIIFVSKKAANSFAQRKSRDDDRSFFDPIKIDNVPHPSCAWWNMASKACNGMTGRQKFINILKS